MRYQNILVLTYLHNDTFYPSFLRNFVINDEYSVYKVILLLACMDIEMNPGPNMTDVRALDIFHLNTRSIRNKTEYINNIVDDYHILCFSETHLDDSVDSASIQFQGFDSPLRKDRSRNGGGVMMYMSNLLKYTRRHDLESQRLETIWVEVNLKSFTVLVCCFYRSDFTATQSFFISELQDSIEAALDVTPHVLLVGDINIDFLPLTNLQLRDCLSLFNLTNVIKEPTRITPISSTLIDPIIVSYTCTILDSGTLTLDSEISDHKATYVCLQIPISLSQCYYRDVWNYKNANYNQLNDLIRQHDWDSDINETLTVDGCCQNFSRVFLQFCKTCIPCSKVLTRPNDKPWFTSELRYNIRIRNRLRKKAFQTHSITDFHRYKTQRNKVNNMKKFAKYNYNNNVEDTISNTERGSKTFWQIMGRFMGKYNSDTVIPPLKMHNGDYAFTDIEKASTLNDYFCTISSVDDSNTELPFFETRTNNEIADINILESEIVDKLGSLKVNKACGPDGISHRMLKYICKTTAVPLCKLFNMSLQRHTYPTIWKSATVMPIFKKGDRSEVSNYRPISLISCVGKSFERVVFKHVHNYLLSNSLIYKYQSGFLPGHSTVHHLIEVVHHTCLALENQKINCQVFCDISKAFDRVWHRGLIHKLKKYGIKGNLLAWFENYLYMRHQSVSINNTRSSSEFITAGVSQGSVVGPMLFLIYINDISEALSGIARLFADDTSLSFSSADPAEIERILNQDLSKLSAWAKIWLVIFNATTTEVMITSNIYFDYDIRLSMDNIILKIVETHKHLGIVLASNNKWSAHIDTIIQSAAKQVSFLRKLKYRFSKATLNKVYCTYIRPLLEYASEVWDGCNQAESRRLEQVQLNAARIVTGLPIFASLNSLYYETGWDTLAERRKYKKLNLMYKIVNNESPSNLSDILPNRVDQAANYNLRNSENFQVPFSRLCSFDSSFFPATLRLWNDLDLSIRNSSTLVEFKAKLRNQDQKDKANDILSIGERKHSIILTRIRHNCSSLNTDLNRVNIVPSSACSCGANFETAQHYFFECRNYTNQRYNLLRALSFTSVVTLDTLVYGCSTLDNERNKLIINAVLVYIKDSKRFD